MCVWGGGGGGAMRNRQRGGGGWALGLGSVTPTLDQDALLYQNIKKTRPFDWFTNRKIYDSRC